MNAVVLERIEMKHQKSNLITAPYPAQIHFYPELEEQIDYSKKALLVSSAWNSRYPMRWTLADMCQKRRDCEHVELGSNSDRYDHTSLYRLTARSVFCLSPHGDSSTRKAFWDALLVGCINVVYSNVTKMPFDDIIDYSKLTVYIPKGKMRDTFTVLKSLSKEEIAAKQEYIDKNRIHFQYTVMEEKDSTMDPPFSKKDAFNLLIDEIYQKSLLRAPTIKI
eukprot:Phypoly_transcript_18034.p1 GENE.Phypoly_transcript_18034~~Phypoly_transcript_18034.p1  ORF type:complete len:243 (+),score=25.84 Phypoly_transcript_18034:68-730(+)